MFNFAHYLGRAYDAVVDRKRRRSFAIDTRAEDKLLLPLERDKLVSTGRRLRRNDPIAAWAIRKHLDYVSTYTFQVRTKDVELNKRIEALFDWWQRPFNCDVSGRHNLQRLIRMIEGLRTVEGDAFIYKISDGHIQIIEGDRIRTPFDTTEFKENDFDPSLFTHGVQTTDTGKALNYAICDRNGVNNSFKLREVVPAKYVYQLGYYDRYDQIRGVSPLTSAMNTLRDIGEANEYALAKMKIAQLFALKYTHATAAGEDDKVSDFDFNAGPGMFELDPGDDADFLESKTPSSEFQEYMEKAISMALKALDIPYSFFDESHTNYSGARQALLQYEQSADIKRADLQQLLNNLTVWRLSLFIADGDLVLPDGMQLDDIDFEWIPAALPWIDPLKEIAADSMAVRGGFASRQQLCRERGSDFFRVADQIAQENEYLVSLGLGTDVENITIPLEEILNDNASKDATAN